MCGRLVGVKNKIELEHRIRQLTDPAFWDYLQRTSDEFSRISSLGNYNAAPTQVLTVLSERLIDGELVPSIDDAVWGLLPVWAKDRAQGSRAFNARSETAAEKPTFRSAYTKRRGADPGQRLLRMAEARRRQAAVLHLPRSRGRVLFRRPLRLVAAR